MGDDAFFDRYADLDLQRRMVSDARRTRAFVEGIGRAVRPGQRVLDVGCGTGILALAAARAGAQVVAIDRAAVVEHAARLAKVQGLDDRIRYLMGDVRELQVDAPFDWVVSEWLGNFAFVEDMWSDVADARDRLLRADGGMLPGRVRLMLAPIDDPVLYHGEGPGFWRRPVADFDLSALEDSELAQGLSTQLRIDPAALVAPGTCMMDLDLRDAGAAAATASGSLRWHVDRPGSVNGFAGWFDVELAGAWYSTGPGEPESHWAQTYLPCRPRPVEPGPQILEWSLSTDPDEPRHLRMVLTWQGERLGFRLE
jgi:SAM-dependent methyltransferase